MYSSRRSNFDVGAANIETFFDMFSIVERNAQDSTDQRTKYRIRDVVQCHRQIADVLERQSDESSLQLSRKTHELLLALGETLGELSPADQGSSAELETNPGAR